MSKSNTSPTTNSSAQVLRASHVLSFDQEKGLEQISSKPLRSSSTFDAGWYLSRCHFPPECRRSGAENTASKVLKSSTNEPPQGTGVTQLAKLGILKRANPSPPGSKAGWEASNWTGCSSSMFQRSIETQMFPWWKLMVSHSPNRRVGVHIICNPWARFFLSVGGRQKMSLELFSVFPSYVSH